jgi:hypothetical protein
MIIKPLAALLIEFANKGLLLPLPFTTYIFVPPSAKFGGLAGFCDSPVPPAVLNVSAIPPVAVPVAPPAPGVPVVFGGEAFVPFEPLIPPVADINEPKEDVPPGVYVGVVLPPAGPTVTVTGDKIEGLFKVGNELIATAPDPPPPPPPP